MIAFICPRFSSPFVVEILASAEQAAYDSKKHRGIMPFSTWSLEEERDKLLQEMLDTKKASAVVLITTWPPIRFVNEYKKAGIPLIVVEFNVMGVHSIMMDNFIGGNLAGNYLVPKYGENLAIVAGNVTKEEGREIHPAALDRLKGFRSSLMRQRVMLDEKRIISVFNYSREEGEVIIEKFIKDKNLPRAIFCAAGDMMAVAMIDTLKKHGLRVPHDAAIVGYDDIPIAEHMTPSLTTLRQPLKEIGQRIFKTAADAIEGNLKEPVQIIVQPELRERDSA
jgi:LacI family transcriptional regulator